MQIKTTMKAMSVAVLMAAGTGIASAQLGTPMAMDVWDANADGMLDENEFSARFNDGDWYGDWDGDGDGLVSSEEFTDINAGWGDAPGGVDENGLFDIWDADEDGLLDDDEVAEGAFASWDQDRNDLVDTNEFEEGIGWFNW